VLLKKQHLRIHNHGKEVIPWYTDTEEDLGEVLVVEEELD
jgi:hypothetical protein